MAKVRVHELAKAHDMSAQDVLDKLRKAGIKVKAPASAVDEDQAKAAIEGRPLPSNGAASKPAEKAPERATPPPTVRRAPPAPPAASDRVAAAAQRPRQSPPATKPGASPAAPPAAAGKPPAQPADAPAAGTPTPDGEPAKHRP